MDLKDKLSKITLIIFDIDGVLVDVSSSYRLAIKKTAEFFSQQDIHLDDIQALKNESGFNNDWDLTQELLKRKNIYPDKDKIIAKFQSFYWGSNGEGLIQKESWLLSHDLLKTISQRYLLAIFTGRPRLEADFVLNKNKVIPFFKPVLAMEDVTNAKPDPEGLVNICQQLAVSNDKACYLGDTFDDIRAAKKAGILAIGVIPPSGKADLIPQFLSEGAYDVLDNINKLSNYILT